MKRIGASLFIFLLVFTSSHQIYAKKITLKTPNGGGTLVAGASTDITWDTEGNVENVKIDLTIDNGITWHNITPSIPNTNTYSWTVPEVTSENCKIKVSDTKFLGPSDVSDSTFKIIQYNKLFVTSPNGGENLFIGATQEITWSTYGIVDTITIEFSKNNGVSWESVITRIANTGDYTWTIPNTVSDSCLIKISDVKIGGPSDQSDSAFVILEQRSITVTSPNGKEELIATTNHHITWISKGSIDSVKIDFSNNNGIGWSPVIQAAPNIGSFTWTVSDSISDSCKIKITDVRDTGTSDISDAPFKIKELLKLEITKPNGGEVYEIGSKEKITWMTMGSIDSVKVQFSSDNGANWITFTSRTANAGSYEFYVPDKGTKLCRIKITSVTDTSIYDISDTTFAIIDPSHIIQAKPGAPGITALTGIGPNPVSSRLTINVSLVQQEQVNIGIYSLKGQLVTTVIDKSLKTGYYTFTWHPVDNSNNRVPAGLYIVAIQIGKKSFKKMVTCVK